MALLFYITYGTWLASEILISQLFRSKKTDKQKTDKGSLYIIWVLIIAGNYAAVYVSNIFRVPISHFAVIQYIGLTLIYIGMFFRVAVILTLRKYFTVSVTIKQDHKLKTSGFYKIVRHPSYFASFISFFGFGVSLNNWISLAIVTGFVLTAFAIRIRIEEKLLIEHFGSDYLNYMKQTKRLIPFIY